MDTTQSSDVVFVGGGVIGLSSAWQAARAGLRVTVADPEPGRGASWVAAGMLAAVAEAYFGETDLGRLLRVAASRWPAFAAELAEATGEEVGFRTCGTLSVAMDAADRRAAEDLLGYQHSLGLPGESLDWARCRELVPGLAPGISGGVYFPDDHQVDNRRLVASLLRAVEKAGVQVRREAVAGLVTGPTGRVAGVCLAGGDTLGAATVVLSAGAESGRVPGVPEAVRLPVRPVKGHILRLAGPPGHPFLPVVVRGMVRGRPCYMVPREDGSVVVGATSEEKGFDRRVQAGAVRTLLDDARELVPEIDELELVECIAGLRPGSPDNAPFIGWTDAPGLMAATGHFRHGVLLTPITAQAVVALLVGGPVPPEVAPFSPTRPIQSEMPAPPPATLPQTVHAGAAVPPVPGGHVPADHVAADHVPADHVAADHVPADHVPADHVAADHVAADHVAADHVAAGTGTGEAGSVEVRVNGEEMRLGAGTTLAEVVERVWPTSQGVAVALGQEVVPRSRWASTVLAEGARIEIVTAAAGG